MSTEVRTQEQQTQTPAESDLSGLTFADYEKARRGEKLEGQHESSALAEKAEQKKSSDSETEETEETDKDDHESEESDESKDEDGAKGSETDKPKKKSGYQRRVDKLNERARSAQQEAEYWKRRALEGATDSKRDAQDVKTPAAKSEGAAKPDPANYETHAEYVEALTDWKLEQRSKADKEQSEKARLEAEHKKLQESYAEKVKAFADKTPDYAEVLAEIDDVQFSPAALDAIQSSDFGPQVAYELAKNREEAERIAKLPPSAAYKAIGKLEARIEARASEPKPEPKKLTNAPKPIEPVGSGKGTVAKSIDDPNISFAEYERLRRQQMKRKNA